MIPGAQKVPEHRGVHAAIIGPTLFGKSFASKCLARDFEAKGRKCLVLDPFGTKWNVSFQCRNIDNFIAMAKKSRNCSLFVDEAGQLDLRNPEHDWLLTGARHWGHVTHIIGQSGVYLSPVQRAQISRLFLFRTTEETARFWYSVFCDKDVYKSLSLTKYQFLHCVLGAPIKVCTLKTP